MHTPAICFASLSRADLAHVRRCQHVAQAEGLSVVSSGVLAAPAGSAPAGAHFWLVSSPLSGVVSVVWLADGRLCCGCARRRAGALSCSHAQAVRLWLLAAAGVRVPSLSPVPPVPPEPPCPPSSPSGGAAVPAGGSPPAPALCPGCGQVMSGVGHSHHICPTWQEHGKRLAAEAEAWGASSTVGGSPPAPAPVVVAEPEPERAPVMSTAICPGCEQPAPVSVLIPFGVCLSCLDLMAEAERQPRPVRCCVCGVAPAVAEVRTGAFCAEHLAREESTRFYTLDGELVDSWSTPYTLDASGQAMRLDGVEMEA